MKPPPTRSEAILELNADCELQLARVGGSTGSRPRADRTVALDVATRVAEVDVVEGVECVRTELEGIPFPDREILHRRHVSIEESRSPGVVASAVSDIVETGVGEAIPQTLRLIVGQVVARTAADAGLQG